MKTWAEAWDDATWEQKRSVIRWKPGVEHNAHIRVAGRNQCAGCLEFFSGDTAFDDHRTGPFGTPTQKSKRRCLTIPEMLKKGFRRDSYFYWTNNAAFRGAENADS